MTDKTKNKKTNNFVYIITTVINLIFISFELLVGVLIGSVSLISDAIHNLSDVLGIVIAFIGNLLAKIRPTKEHTYGLRNATIIAAFTNALILVVTIAILLFETVQHFFQPFANVQGGVIASVAFIGVLISGLTAYLFSRNIKKDVNQKGVFLHFVADGAVSMAVVIAGILIQFTGWSVLDPLISLIAIFAISTSAWRLLREAWNLITNGVPENIDEKEVEKYLLSFDNVRKINDLHIWGISTTETAITVHLSCKNKSDNVIQVDKISEGLKKKFDIGHITIQIDTNSSHHDEPDI